MKLRSKMFIYIGIPSILIIFLSILFISVITSSRVSEELDKTLKSSNSALKEQVSELVMTSATSYIRAIGYVTNRNLTRIYNSYETGLIKDRTPMEMISTYLSNEDFLNNGYIYLVDRDGKIVTHPDKTRVGSDSISKEWLLSRDTREEEFFTYQYGGRSKVLYKHYNELLNLYIMTTAFVDDFTSSLNFQELVRVMDNVKIQEQGYPIIISNTGVIIYHRDRSLINRNVVNVKDAYGTYIFKKILREKSGKFKYFWNNERNIPQEMFIYYQYDRNSGFTICSTGSVEDYYTTLNELIRTVLITLFIIVLVTTTLIYRLSNSLSDPIEKLSDYSRNFENIDKDINTRGIITKEIKDLYISFNAMRRSIREKILQLSAANRELTKHQDNLEDIISEKTKELKKAQKQLIESEKMSSLGGLVAGVAHEINTPVGIGVTIASHIELQTKEILENFNEGAITKTALEDYLKSINNQSSILLSNMNRSAELINSFKQIAVDQTNHEKRVFNLEEYLDEISISLKHEYTCRDIKLVVKCPSYIEIDSYPGAISQIVSQLVLNSINHGLKESENGEISISVAQKGEFIQLTVRDNGIGIPEDKIDKIFDPFFTTNRQEGIGLGLNIVYNQVTHVLKGEVSCQSSSNETIFNIIFPKTC